jgi:hypothetical protein
MEAPRQPEATRTEGFAPAAVSQSRSAASQACPCSGEVGSMTQRTEAAWHHGRSFAQQTLRNTVRSAPWCLSCGDCARTHCSLTRPLTGNGEETAIIRCAAGQSHADCARTAVTSHCSRAPPPISTRRTPGGRHGRTGQDRPRCFPTEAVIKRERPACDLPIGRASSTPRALIRRRPSAWSFPAAPALVVRLLVQNRGRTHRDSQDRVAPESGRRARSRRDHQVMADGNSALSFLLAGIDRSPAATSCQWPLRRAASPPC